MSEEASKAPANWPAELRRELELNSFNGCVGQMLVSESDRVRVWSLSLKPGERVGFHRHVLDYFWTVLTDGRARSHYSDGRVVVKEYYAGETKHMSFGKGEFMLHDIENVGDTLLLYTTVEFLDSANPPLPIPSGARLAAVKAA